MSGLAPSRPLGEEASSRGSQPVNRPFHALPTCSTERQVVHGAIARSEDAVVEVLDGCVGTELDVFDVEARGTERVP